MYLYGATLSRCCLDMEPHLSCLGNRIGRRAQAPSSTKAEGVVARNRRVPATLMLADNDVPQSNGSCWILCGPELIDPSNIR